MRNTDHGSAAQAAAHSTADRSWDAFARHYDAHEARLYRVARLLLPGRAAAAEDAVADSFIRAHRAWAEHRIDDFYGYARQTLVNHVLGLFREHETAERYLALVGSADDAAEATCDDVVVDAKLLFEALTRLPDRRRATVVLRYYEQLSYLEIAALMGISVAAVKAHVFAGVAQLRELVAEATP